MCLSKVLARLRVSSLTAVVFPVCIAASMDFAIVGRTSLTGKSSVRIRSLSA